MRECEIPLDLPTANAKGRPQHLLLLGVDDAPSQKHPATLADLDDLRLGRHRVTDIDRAEELERHLRSQERPQTAQMGQQSTQIEETAQSDCSGLNGGALPAVGSDKQFAHPIPIWDHMTYRLLSFAANKSHVGLCTFVEYPP